MFSHVKQWRFGVRWQNDGTSDGSSDGATGFGASVSFGGAPMGQGGIGSDAVASGQAGQAGQANAATSAVNAAANAAAAYGGGPGGIGFGGQTSTGGFGGGQTAAVGGPTGGGAGTATGGSATGPSGGGGMAPGGIGQPGFNLANALASMISYGAGYDIGVPPGYATGVPTATSPVAVSNLGPPSLNPNVVSQLNSQLSGLNATALAPSPSLAQLIAQLMGNTLGGAAPGGLASLGAGSNATMGYPSVEGVSPGVTAAPAGPAPSYATTSFQAENPAFYSSPSQLAVLAQQANNQPTEAQAVNTTQAPAAPAQTANQNSLMAFLSSLMGTPSLPGIAGTYIG